VPQLLQLPDAGRILLNRLLELYHRGPIPPDQAVADTARLAGEHAAVWSDELAGVNPAIHQYHWVEADGKLHLEREAQVSDEDRKKRSAILPALRQLQAVGLVDFSTIGPRAGTWQPTLEHVAESLHITVQRLAQLTFLVRPTRAGLATDVATAGVWADDHRVSSREIAEHFSLPLDRLRKCVERLRAKDDSCYEEVDNSARGPRGDRYLYVWGRVKGAVLGGLARPSDVRRKKSEPV